MAQPSRGEMSRAATSRPVIGGESRGRLEIDISGLPEGMEATWVRESVLGERDPGNIQQKLEQGYVPVTNAHLPGRALPTLADDGKIRAPAADEPIRRQGSILMMRPKRDAVAERQYLSRANKDALAGAARLGQGDEGGVFDENTQAMQPVIKEQVEGRRRPLSDE